MSSKNFEKRLTNKKVLAQHFYSKFPEQKSHGREVIIFPAKISSSKILSKFYKITRNHSKTDKNERKNVVVDLGTFLH